MRLDKRLLELIKEKERINRQIINEMNLITDYEAEFKKRSLELFGKVKDFYSVKEVSELTGYAKSTLYYYNSIGSIKIRKGKISKEDTFALFVQAN